MLTLLLLAALAVLAGTLAQTWKGRTGAAWGLLALAGGLIWWGVVAAVAVRAGVDLDSGVGAAVELLMVHGVSALCLLGLIASLPKRR